MKPLPDIGPAQGALTQLFGDQHQQQAALAADPGLHNVLGTQAEWARRPKAMDFLDPASPYFLIKRLSTQIYLRFFAPHLDTLPPDARVLDAACGIGRFTLELARRFPRVVAFDPCWSSLDACRRHLAENDLDNVELHWADLSWLDQLPPHTFDAVFAVELLCYTTDPNQALQRLVRVAKPGAAFFLSVEGRPGALAVQGAGKPMEMLDILRGRPMQHDGDCRVLFFDRDQLADLLARAGLKQVVIEGSHYFGEGPFWQSVEDQHLNDPAYTAQILQAEEACRRDPLLAPWARVFAAVGGR